MREKNIFFQNIQQFEDVLEDEEDSLYNFLLFFDGKYLVFIVVDELEDGMELGDLFQLMEKLIVEFMQQLISDSFDIEDVELELEV